MAKRLKLRISRAITSSFRSCRSKDPSVSNPIPSFFRFSPNLAVPPPQPPPSAVKPDHLSSKSHVEPQLFQWQNKEEEWQLVYHKSPPTKKKKIIRRNKKERGESSRSFSSDSSAEFHPIREKPRKKKKKKTRAGCVTTGLCRLSISSSPARLSVFKKLIPTAVEGKVRDSFAVVKKSEDPYEDFKRSMMDMIWEKQMFEEGDLEQLLQCFLSLNSPRHHKVIVDAFAEIWNAMFADSHITAS
ncbi:hypothetical protein ACET3Z_018045 [Daucus carota]